MFGFLARYHDRRRKDDHTAIRLYLANHGPAFVYDIGTATGIGWGRLYIRLAELERADRVNSKWVPAIGREGRRRLYDIPHAAPVSEATP